MKKSEILMDVHELSYEMSIIAEEFLEKMIEKGLLKEKDRKAFVLTLKWHGHFLPALKTVIGTSFPSEEFALGCWEISQNKAETLIENQEFILSAQNRNPEKKKYGGAITVVVQGMKLSISVSGLKEWEDTAGALYIAREFSKETDINVGNTNHHVLLSDEIFSSAPDLKGVIDSDRPVEKLLIKLAA